jgi:hypothetical protein
VPFILLETWKMIECLYFVLYTVRVSKLNAEKDDDDDNDGGGGGGGNSNSSDSGFNDGTSKIVSAQ